MKFSVIMVNYASWPLTLRCIESLQLTRYRDFEIFVVDNDSVKPPELPSWVRLIRNKENVGFARAHNRGISGPRIVDSEGELQLSARREINALSGFLGRTSLLTRLFPKSSLVKSQFPAVTNQSHPTSVDWVSGACMVVRKETLRDVGPLDERFFMYFEDADLCRRARAAGWLVYYLPHVEIVHQTGASSCSKPKAIWLLHKSAFLYHRKHGVHGPLGAYSAMVLAGLALRALAKIGISLFAR